MNTNLFLDFKGALFFHPFAPIREYSCSFVAGILFFE